MPKLTAEQITNVYDEIGTMRVTLDADPNRGLQYVKERLTLCRAMQDRLSELHLKVSRALGDVWQEALALRMQHTLAPTTALEQRLQLVNGERQDHALLEKMIKLQGQLLARTSMDVRLLADLTKEQIKLGEIDPQEAGLTRAMVPADLAPPPPVIEPSTATPIPVVETVDLSGPAGIMEADSPRAVAKTDAVNFDDLFGLLTHGQTAPGSDPSPF